MKTQPSDASIKIILIRPNSQWSKQSIQLLPIGVPHLKPALR
jgi:hypothetical protein